MGEERTKDRIQDLLLAYYNRHDHPPQEPARCATFVALDAFCALDENFANRWWGMDEARRRKFLEDLLNEIT